LPLRIRAFVDFLRRAYAHSDYWRLESKQVQQ
jgi:hypothetical protein